MERTDTAPEMLEKAKTAASAEELLTSNSPWTFHTPPDG